MPELQTSDAFEWVPYPWGDALRCQPLADVADHCFTTRRPIFRSGAGVSGDGWPSMARAFGVSLDAIVRLRQVHSAEVVTIRATDAPRAPAGEWAVADAVVTDDPAVALSIMVADCVPLLIGDRSTGAVAAVHAGWRGAAGGVVGAAVRALASAFSANPADLVAAVGPSIGPCCYRVGAELLRPFLDAGQLPAAVERWFAPSPPVASLRGVPGSEPASSDGRPALWLDMWGAVSDQLVLAGVATDNVHVARLCTSCGRDVFHSYRVDGPKAGRMVGVIRMGEKT